MQPYLFPYLGYWQLISAVDQFVILDDVNYIKKSFINRNSILISGKPTRFTLELMGASQNVAINEINIGNNTGKILKTIEMSYKKAPYFDSISPVLSDILLQKEKNLAKFIGYSLKKIAELLNVNTNFIYSSSIEQDKSLKSQNKIINIVNSLNGTQYINAIGGRELYSRTVFNNNGIELAFIEMEKVFYKQNSKDFIENLSIVDVLMFNGIDNTRHLFNRYSLKE